MEGRRISYVTAKGQPESVMIEVAPGVYVDEKDGETGKMWRFRGLIKVRFKRPTPLDVRAGVQQRMHLGLIQRAEDRHQYETFLYRVTEGDPFAVCTALVKTGAALGAWPRFEKESGGVPLVSSRALDKERMR